MSRWHAFQITVTLGSDLHCGDLPLGFVARTHPYVPAHIPWYAAVAALIRLSGKDNKFTEYSKMENRLDHCLRFSPFFIMEDGNLLLPWDDEDKRNIQNNHLDGQYGVSLSYGSRSALKNRLFEMETITAVSRNSQPARLRGICFTKSGEQYFDNSGKIFSGTTLQEIIGKSLWGGQQNKGLGCLAQVEIADFKDNQHGLFGSMTDDRGDYPQIAISAGKNIAYPLLYNHDTKIDMIQGRLAPLTGRRFKKNKGPGLQAESGVVIWRSGWHLNKSHSTISLSDRRFGTIEDGCR